jgi:RecA-family ATPase
VQDLPLYQQRYEEAQFRPSGRASFGGTVSITPTPFVWQDPSSIPPRPWVLGRWLLRSTVAAVVAPGGVGKSSLMATTLLSLATGRPLLGKTVWGGPLRAWYWNLEDDRDELHRQIAAAAIQHNVDPAQLADRMWIDSGPDGQGLCTALEDEGGFRVLEPVYEALHEALKSRGIDVLIVDPFVSSHGADENSNTRIDAIAKAWARVAAQADCVVVLVHHSRKLGGQKVTAELSRGAVALWR